MSAAANLSEAAALAALEASWPPEQAVDRDGLRLRRAPGAGSRVNSARLIAPLSGADLDASMAEIIRFYRGHGQTPLLQLGAGDQEAIERAKAAGFVEFDPCLLAAAPIEAVADAAPGDARTLSVATPFAALEELWSEGDGGPERRAVMARARGPAQVIAARVGDRLAGAVFAAVADGTCFEHALHVAPSARGRGVGRTLMRAAARFGRSRGAARMAVSVRIGNQPARRLFDALGFEPLGGYAYWRLQETTEGETT